uniref:RNA-directed DNA polymerase, eukaryota, reverse transcriptase zinc-binding domain protein n=1 Tax=Tanacetum cinerariifolium TaxID=118510 RepID=A0A6L2MQQ6_TANCI|nr:RNA-directed DNA polymerase, eukaryota, reverse transcriptase zinc-binding domain protein [Tanacetum cinerariifolium]
MLRKKPVRRIGFTEYAILFGRIDTLFRLQHQYAVLDRRFDTPHPTGGYAVLGILPPGGNSLFIALIPKTQDAKNVTTIVNVLKCFFLALGLKINFHKSKLMGIGIPQAEVRSAAESIGCSTFVSPISFLGVKVGGLMSKRSSWDEVIDRKLALVDWQEVLAFKKNGGLGVSSFFAFRALLFKWIWRFIYQDTSLWFRVIQAMYGKKGIDLFSFVKKKLAMVRILCFRKSVGFQRDSAKLDIGVTGALTVSPCLGTSLELAVNVNPFGRDSLSSISLNENMLAILKLETLLKIAVVILVRDRCPRGKAIVTNEPVDSLIMGDEHLDAILATESDELIKSSVENLVPNPSESEGENGCDVPYGFTTFSNTLFDAEYEFDPSNDQSLSDEDFLIDSLLDEFADELTLLKSIPSGINETDYHPENEIRLSQRLLYNNSSPRSPEEFVSENSNADVESFSPFPIRIEDSNSFMEEIDLTFTPDDPMPPGIEEDDDDSKDILIREELLDNYSFSFLENKSFHFDIPSSSRPPVKPPDGNTGILNIKMMGDVSDQKVHIPKLMITLFQIRINLLISYLIGALKIFNLLLNAR